MKLEELKEKVQLALSELQEREHHLLLHGLNERAITAHLAKYLAKQFPNYDVDPEYDGNVQSYNGSGRKFLYGSPVYPDIIVHKRGTNANNLLIIEVKKSVNSGRQQAADGRKLVGYISENCEFRYPFGLYIGIGVKASRGLIRQDWFEGDNYI